MPSSRSPTSPATATTTRPRIVSAAFAGMNRVKQHQLVYASLKGKMGGELHALALETSAPS